MKEIKNSIEIDASPERVWQVLTDFEQYPQWNPFMRRISGSIEEGSRLEVTMGASGKSTMTFRPVLLKVQDNREMRWLGRLLLPKIFDGEHSFAIEPINQNRVRFTQSEKFSGLLLPIFARSMDADTQRGFAEMNKALKARAEQPSA